MKLLKETRVKITHENIFFQLPCSVLEFKMSSNIVKLDKSGNWNRRSGHLNHVNVVRNELKRVGQFEDVCNVCAWAKITKIPVPKLAKTKQIGNFRV